MKLHHGAAVLGLLAALAPALGGCTTGGRQTVGGLSGAALGGLLGAQVGGDGAGQLAATAAGAVIGGFLGSEAGASLDRADRAYYNRPRQYSYAQPSYAPSYAYAQPSYAYAPQGYYNNAGYAYSQRMAGYPPPGPAANVYASGWGCQQVPATVTVNGYPQTAYVTACPDSSGRWSVAN